jgi:ferredoxin
VLWQSSVAHKPGGPRPFEPATEARVSDILELKHGGLTIIIDRLLCVGFGDCIEIAPEAFEFDKDGIVMFKDTIAEVERDRLIQACDICPVDALTILDEAGAQIVP